MLTRWSRCTLIRSTNAVWIAGLTDGPVLENPPRTEQEVGFLAEKITDQVVAAFQAQQRDRYAPAPSCRQVLRPSSRTAIAERLKTRSGGGRRLSRRAQDPSVEVPDAADLTLHPGGTVAEAGS